MVRPLDRCPVVPDSGARHAADGRSASLVESAGTGAGFRPRSKIGSASFVLVHSDGSREVVDPREHPSRKRARTTACIPDLPWQFARFAEARYRHGPGDDVAVHASTACPLDTREPVALVRRRVDLASIPRDAPTARWPMPNREPLPTRCFR